MSRVVRVFSKEGFEFKREPGNAGYDLRAADDEILLPGQRLVIPTGMYTEFADDLVLDVRPRSGLAIKQGITVLNTPGTIDSIYRGEIGVILINHSNQEFIIKKGDRIAQAVFLLVQHPEFEIVESKESLTDTKRGVGGFGSTGTK